MFETDIWSPFEPVGGNKPVEQQRDGRERDQRHVQSRPHLHEKRQIIGEQRHGQRKDQAAQARIGVVRGSEIIKKAKISNDPLCS